MPSLNLAPTRSHPNSTMSPVTKDRPTSLTSITTNESIDPAEDAKFRIFYKRLSREVNEKILEAASNDGAKEKEPQEESKALSPEAATGPRMLDFRDFMREDFERFKTERTVYKGAEVVTKRWI